MSSRARACLPLISVCVLACSTASPPTGATQAPPPAIPGAGATYDVDALGVPKIAVSDYIDLDAIGRISRFRSSAGHDYHDDFESCRSMKHYFEPKPSIDWSGVRIYSPVQGTLTMTRDDFAGRQLVIAASANPAFTFIIFHVNPSVAISAGSVYAAGQQIGTHIGSQTMSDIAVGVRTPAGYKLVSWFDVMADNVFQAYASRGLGSRASGILSRQARDDDPLGCDGEAFVRNGTLPVWVTLTGT